MLCRKGHMEEAGLGYKQQLEDMSALYSDLLL